MRRPDGLTARRRRLRWTMVAVLAAGCATAASVTPDHSTIPEWTTRAIPEARGEIKTLPDAEAVKQKLDGYFAGREPFPCRVVG